LFKIKKYFETILLKIITNIFRKDKSKALISLNQNSNILIIIFGNRSEALLTTPLIRIIKKNTNSNITILSSDENFNVFNYNTDVTNNIVAKNKFREIFIHLYKISKLNFGLVVSCDEIFSQNAILYTSLIKSKYKIGFKYICDKIFTHLIEKQNQVSTHYVDRKLKLCEFFNFPIDKSNLNLIYSPSKDAEETVDKFLLSVFDSKKMLFLLNISFNNSNLFWGEDNFRRLIRYIKNYDVNIIISSSEKDILLADNISSGKEKIYLTDDFDKFAALVSKVNFVFTPNSFVLQLSAVFKKPVFCLFEQNSDNELIQVPYRSDFDFILSENNDLSDLHFGKVLNAFIPYFDFIFENFK
jgi:ADP-heptose:LPS heptosyltransferase